MVDAVEISSNKHKKNCVCSINCVCSMFLMRMR